MSKPSREEVAAVEAELDRVKLRLPEGWEPFLVQRPGKGSRDKRDTYPPNTEFEAADGIGGVTRFAARSPLYVNLHTRFTVWSESWGILITEVEQVHNTMTRRADEREFSPHG